MSCACKNGAPEAPQFELIDSIIEEHKHEKGALIPVLHEAQEALGYLPEDVQAYIAEKLNVHLSEVYGVVSFYSLFSTEPKGKYKISICLGTACYVKGSGEIMAEFEKQLGIKVGQTTEDGHYTLEGCRCLGCCGLAPVLMVNDNVHGRLSTKDVGEIIKKYKELKQ